MTIDNVIDINWVELFGCCTNITTMQANGQGTNGFVRALTASTVTNTELRKKGRKRKQDRGTVVQPASTLTRAHAAIFPKLKILRLTGLNISFSEGNHASGILFDVFKRGIQQRMAASAPLTLHIIDCEISPEHVDDLRKLVQDFHWKRGLTNASGRRVTDETSRAYATLGLYGESRYCAT